MNSKCEFFIAKLVLFMLLFVINNVAIAQISKIKTAQEEIPKEDIVAPYDSLENICWENFRSQVGQTLYLNDDAYYRKRGAFPFEFRKMPGFDFYTNKELYHSCNGCIDSLTYKYIFRGGDEYGTEYNKVVGRSYYVNRLLENPVNKLKKSGFEYAYELIMKGEPYDTVYYCFDSSTKEFQSFINTGYFEKLKKQYIGVEFVVFDELGTYTQLGTGKHKSLPKGTYLKCTDIKIEDGYMYRIILLLHNDNFGDFFVGLGHDMRNLETSETFNLRLQKKAEWIRKYGKSNAELIWHNKVRIGWTKDMCLESWGSPKSINKMTGAGGITEQWVYSNDEYLYFKNGLLTTIQE